VAGSKSGGGNPSSSTAILRSLQARKKRSPRGSSGVAGRGDPGTRLAVSAACGRRTIGVGRTRDGVGAAAAETAGDEAGTVAARDTSGRLGVVPGEERTAGGRLPVGGRRTGSACEAGAVEGSGCSPAITDSPAGPPPAADAVAPPERAISISRSSTTGMSSGNSMIASLPAPGLAGASLEPLAPEASPAVTEVRWE